MRTNHRLETVYLYRLNTSAENVRRLASSIWLGSNELTDRPEFTHR